MSLYQPLDPSYLDSVAARYGPVQALHNVSLVVREGEVVAVLGANGAGKTTTLRAISGVVSRTGVIELQGKPLKGGPDRRLAHPVRRCELAFREDGPWHEVQLDDPSLARVPVVVLSGHGQIAKQVAGLGVNAYCEKPVSMTALLDVLGRFVTIERPLRNSGDTAADHGN